LNGKEATGKKKKKGAPKSRHTEGGNHHQRRNRGQFRKRGWVKKEKKEKTITKKKNAPQRQKGRVFGKGGKVGIAAFEKGRRGELGGEGQGSVGEKRKTLKKGKKAGAPGRGG